MLTKRIVPCLDVKDGRVVKGVNFTNLRDAGDPVTQARIYDKMGADDKGKLEAAVERAKEALKKGEHDEILSARDGLNAAWHEVAQKIYSQEQAQQTDGGQAEQQAEEPKKADESGAVDADYEVVD